MIFFNSFSMVALFLIATIVAGNSIVFPTERSTKTTTVTTTKFSTETITTVDTSTETTATADASTEITTAGDSLTKKHSKSNMEPSCGSQTGAEYCANPPGYPNEQIILQAVASQQGILHSFFEEVKPDEITPLFPGTPFEEFENICSTTSDHIIPRAARNTRGQFQFIVNQPAGNQSFTQRVQVGECVNPGEECGDGAVWSTKTECHQEMLEHKLVAVSNDGAHMVVDTFRFPSCCTCRIIKLDF